MGILLAETTTLGVRFYEAERQILPRKTERLETPWGTVGLKRVVPPRRSVRPGFYHRV